MCTCSAAQPLVTLSQQEKQRPADFFIATPGAFIFYVFWCQPSIWILQSGETQVVDPRVIHVMLAEDDMVRAPSRNMALCPPLHRRRHPPPLPPPQGQAGNAGRRRKESDGGKCEAGRRRRNASEGDGDANLKRFKGEGGADSQNGSGSGVAVDEVVAMANSSTAATGVACGHGQTSPNLAPVPTQGQPGFPFSAYAKENGRTPVSQDRVGSGYLPAPCAPTPPPLRPAPSPFSNTSFPSLGQMPSLVPAASTKTAPALGPEREKEGLLTGFPSATAVPSPVSTAARVLPEGSTPSITSTATTLGFSQNPPTWGGAQTAEVSMSVSNLRSVLVSRWRSCQGQLESFICILHHLTSQVKHYGAIGLTL